MQNAFAIGSKLWPGLSKLIEEAGEVQQVCGKLIATGGDANHWDGSNLRARLEEEIADLTAALAFVGQANNLDIHRVEARVREKLALFNKWHEAQFDLAAKR